MSTPTETPTTEEVKTDKPSTEDLMKDTARLAEVKLSKTDEATLAKLKELGLYSDEELSKLEAGMRVAKLQHAEEKGQRGPRGVTTTFSPVAANVFRARILEDKSIDEVKNAFGTDLSDTNSKTREVAFKLLYVAIQAGTVSKDWIEEQLKTLNTGKERERKANKDAVVGGAEASPNGAAPAAPTAGTESVNEPEENDNPFESADLDSITESE